jgi:hypothetical protein
VILNQYISIQRSIQKKAFGKEAEVIPKKDGSDCQNGAGNAFFCQQLYILQADFQRNFMRRIICNQFSVYFNQNSEINHSG